RLARRSVGLVGVLALTDSIGFEVYSLISAPWRMPRGRCLSTLFTELDGPTPAGTCLSLAALDTRTSANNGPCPHSRARDAGTRGHVPVSRRARYPHVRQQRASSALSPREMPTPAGTCLSLAALDTRTSANNGPCPHSRQIRHPARPPTTGPVRTFFRPPLVTSESRPACRPPPAEVTPAPLMGHHESTHGKREERRPACCSTGMDRPETRIRPCGHANPTQRHYEIVDGVSAK